MTGTTWKPGTTVGSGLGFRHVQGQGPALVLVHGWMVSGAVWDALALALAGRHLVVPDMRGVGASAKVGGPLTLGQLAEDVLEVVDAAGLRRFVLVAHSMGAQVAALVAAHAPARVERLVLLNPVPAGGLALPSQVAAGFRAAGGDAAALGGILDAACRELTPAARAALLEDALRIPAAHVRDLFDTWTRGGSTAHLKDVAAPTTVLSTDDPFLPQALLQAEVADRIPGARLERLAGCGHYPQVERAGDTAALLRRLLEHGALSA
jgi:non-heme chloroperoxidase